MRDGTVPLSESMSALLWTTFAVGAALIVLSAGIDATGGEGFVGGLLTGMTAMVAFGSVLAAAGRRSR